MKDNSPFLSHDAANCLKAVAIIGVLIIHTLSSLHTSPYTDRGQLVLTISVLLDQMSRISVPMFVALSGYGLSQKYLGKKIKFVEYFQKRIWKLVPKYLLWSIVLILAVWLVPAWHDTNPTQSNWLMQIILGKADYHLYFVPMIFSLYILFIPLSRLYYRHPILTLIVAGLIQVVWLYFFSFQKLPFLQDIITSVDKERYILFTNWLWYFVLGFHLNNIFSFLNQRFVLWRTLLLSITIGLWLYLSFQAVKQINLGVDPLLALRFTRYSLMLYATMGIITLGFLISKVKNYPKLLIWLGSKSYDIYLSHTLWLRILLG